MTFYWHLQFAAAFAKTLAQFIREILGLKTE